MPYVRPNPLTVAHSVALFQHQVLQSLPKDFVRGGGIDVAIESLVAFLMPAHASLDASRECAEAALMHFQKADLNENDRLQEIKMHLLLMKQHLPKVAQIEAFLAVVGILLKAGDIEHGDAAQFCAAIAKNLEIDPSQVPNGEVSGSLPRDFLNYPKHLVERPATAVDLQEGRYTEGGIHLSLRARRILGYAMVAAGIPAVDGVAITNPADDEVEGAVVTVRITCALQDAPIATFSNEIQVLGGRQSIEIPLRELRPDPRLLVQLDEAAEGSIEASVAIGDEVVARVELPLRLLAYSQWCEVPDCFELLAAHVMPNHPALVPVRQAASELLRVGTGQSSQEGYQSGAKRALEIAAATYIALQRCGIHYSNPPASSESMQKIRTPEQVLIDKFGTCLDTACLLAGALEQAGLNAAMFVVQGHAFAGVFVKDVSMSVASLRDAGMVRNHVEAGILVPIETTKLCETQHAPFNEAVSAARKTLFDLPFVALIDINAARSANIRPLPSRILTDGQVVIVHQEAAAAAEPVVLAPRRVQAAKVERKPMPQRLRKWQADLLDLSLRNPLLNVKIGRGGGERLVPPPGELHNVERFLAAEGEIFLAAHDDLTGLQRARGAHIAREMAKEDLCAFWNTSRALFIAVEEKSLRKRLRQMMNQARTMEEESGANILHLSLGTVVWTDPEKDKKVRSPLLTIPVKLDMKARGVPPRLFADLSGGGTVVNQCLLQKLTQAFRFQAPEVVAGWRGDREDADIRVVFDAMRTAIAEDLPGVTLEEDATLCLLHFGKFRMWKDLEDHWEVFMEQPVVRHLVECPGQTYPDPVPLPTKAELESSSAYCPIPIDGSQLEAVVAAARGCSFVLEGPPGTGKSQTITNLIANALAAGKKVLFVAEKRAALEVVKHRLDKVGLGAYCLDIHGKASKPKDLCAQLIKSHDAQFTTDLEAFEKLRKELGVEAEELGRYPKRLHEANRLGRSLWSAYQDSLAVGDGFSVAVPASLFSGGQQALVALRDGLRDLKDVAKNADLQPRHWWGMVSAVDGDSLATPALAAAVSAMAQAHASPLPGLADTAASAVEGLRAPSNLRGLSALLAAREVGCMPTLGSLRAAKSVAQATWQRLSAAAAELDKQLAEVRSLFTQEALDQDLERHAQGIEKAQKAFFLWRGRKVRAAVGAVQPFLRAPAPSPRELIAALRSAVAAIESAEKLRKVLCGQQGLTLPTDWSPLAVEGGAVLAMALTAAREAGSLVGTTDEPVLLAVLQVEGESAGALRSALAARAEAWQVFAKSLKVDDAALVGWLDGRSLTQAVSDSLPRWQSDAAVAFLGLVRWSKLQARLANLEVAGFGGIRKAVLDGTIRAEQALAALDRSVARACVEERRQALGFQRFDGKEHGIRVLRHAMLHTEESEALTDVLPVKILGTRPFGPGERVGVVGDMRRKDLERARPRSIRALLDDYDKAVLELTPCVLASPDSVAQFLVPGRIEFDLVVFDEASQVPVADAIGAIGRGSAVVIVGDSQQMPPTAFFSRTAISDEDAPTEEDVPDMDSILTEARNDGIKPILLSWHYRSQDESLIAFSNRHYYDSRLSSFPAPSEQLDGKGLSWVKVSDGLFNSPERGQNDREADVIVAEVRRRLADPFESRRSLGIVTMNLSQAERVREKLEEAAEGDPALRKALEDDSEDRLFVKNLENVQGDERDVILIGMTYGKGRDGKLRMQFGPLGKAGGEKRWNVLVTRARQQVVVVSSMEPEEIRTHDVSASATGVHHMRAYLEMCKRGVGNSVEARLRPVEQKDLHREDVASALRQRGLHVETNIGLSSFKVDLAIADPEDPGRRLVAVLLDGPGYAARRTVQDRDSLPVSVLQRMMGWPKVVRIWLPEWLIERSRVIDDTVAAYEEAKVELAQSAVLRAAQAGRLNSSGPPVASEASLPERPVHALLREAAESRLSRHQIAAYEATLVVGEAVAKKEEFRMASAAMPVVRDSQDLDFCPYEDETLIGTKEDIADGAPGTAHFRIRSAIDAVLNIEAPIEAERLAKLVARRFGLQRVREDRVRIVLALVDGAQLRKGDFGMFVWKPGTAAADWKAFRRTPPEHSRVRTFDLVAPEEVRNALVFCATKGMGLSDDGAIEELKTIFAVGKASQDFRDRAQAMIAWALATGALERDAKGRLQAKIN